MNEVNNQELQFPVTWHYKIITEKEFPDFLQGLDQLLNKFGINEQPTTGRESANGKYLTYKLTVIFQNREDMEALSEAIAAVPGVKFLL